MNVFISWSGEISRAIAVEFRDWLPLINQHVVPYMSEEDIEKGSHWASHVRKQLESTSFGIVVLTPENTGSIWLHFEAGAIAKSVEEGRLAPVLFGLKQSDIHLPLSMFQTTLFEELDMMRLARAVNTAAGPEARDEKTLERIFTSVWPSFHQKIAAILSSSATSQRGAKPARAETDSILQEVLTLVRQQMRILTNPEELIGREVIALLLRVAGDIEGAMSRLKANERDLALALTARWTSVLQEMRRYLDAQPDNADRAKLLSDLRSYTKYVLELQQMLSTSAARP